MGVKLTIDEELHFNGLFDLASEGSYFANPSDKNIAKQIAKKFFGVYIYQLRTYKLASEKKDVGEQA